jgi:hypothetical protein
MTNHQWQLFPLVLPIAAFVAGCQPTAQEEPVQNDAANEALALPPLPVAESPMDRSAVLTAVAKAASASALGRDDGAEQRPLDGKRFEVRIRFGCATTTQPTKEPVGPFNVRFNSEDRTLRLRAAPDLTLGEPQIATLAGEQVEAVEGFWMRRPWLLADGCPAGTADQQSGESPVSDQRVGLAQFFTATDSRTMRRDNRAYEATKVLAADEAPSRQGYNLVLSGRLRQLPQRRVILCRPRGPGAPPECVVSAQFDRVWIEDPSSKAILAEWGH